MGNLVADIPDPLCEHRRPLKHTGSNRVQCQVCKSFWDLDALNSGMAYDSNYPEMRSHFNPAIGRNKVKTLQYWLKKAHIELEGLRVCEIGFGGGFCLQYLSELSGEVFGVEAIVENIRHAMTLGIRRQSIFLADELPPVLPSKIDLWLFQDSFEHLDDPAGFMVWLIRNSSNSSKILLVMPEGNSISERVLGRLWPHRVPDHCFHWSREGITEFFGKRDFVISRTFKPEKYISIETVMAHAVHKLSRHRSKSRRKGLLPGVVFRFNIGEMGLLFSREFRNGY